MKFYAYLFILNDFEVDTVTYDFDLQQMSVFEAFRNSFKV